MSVKIIKPKTKVEEKTEDALLEASLKFDEKKMRKLVKSDKFLSFFYQDRFARGSAKDQSIGLEAMFQTFVLSNAGWSDRFAKAYKSMSEGKELLSEEWKGYKPNMPVQVVGVKNGRITGDGGGVQVFKNLKAAQKVFPPPEGIDPEENTMQFTWAMRGEVNGKPAGRFETWRAYKMYSTEESVERPIKERFNAKILPPNVEDLEMKTLHVLIGSTAEGLLTRVKKNTGSNANPISLQIMKSLKAIRDAIKSKMDLKGEEALKAFFAVTNGHFDATAPGISSLVKKYKLRADKYSGNVIMEENEQEEKIRELVRSVISRVSEKADINIPDNVVDLQDRLEQKKKDVEWWQAKLNKTRKASLSSIRSMHLQQAKKDVKDLEKALKKAQKNESTEEPVEEAKKSKMIPMEKYGAAFMIEKGALMSVAMLRDGSFETWDGNLDWSEVTAPESQKFLDDINKAFKTKFKMDNFAGR